MSNTSNIMSLFGAFYVDGKIKKSKDEASVVDLAALAMEYRYVFTPELVSALDKLSPAQRGTVFKKMGKAFDENAAGKMSKSVSPLYRAFPNHDIIPMEERLVVYILGQMGFNFDFDYDPVLYGADPITGFQTDRFGANADADEEFTLEFVEQKGNKRRKVRVLKLADAIFIADKVSAMMGNLVPFTPQELSVVKWALKNNIFNADALSSVRFREKMPLVFDFMTVEDYADACNSVTDVLRLAVHMSGKHEYKTYRHNANVRKNMKKAYGISHIHEPDLSLKTKPHFKLATANTKKVLALLEAIISRGNTDHETDFVRHDEKWKRLVANIYTNKYSTRFPLAVLAMSELVDGNMSSWEQSYAQAAIGDKIKLAEGRAGVFSRRLVSLLREAGDAPWHIDAIVAACDTVFPQVDALKLMQLHTHLTKTTQKTERVHMLPNGTILTSAQIQDNVPSAIVSKLEDSLRTRLSGSLPYSMSVEAGNRFIPAGNRAASETDVRTSRGDRVQLSFKEKDTIRFFLFWHEACDVDMSVRFYSKDLTNKGECTYYNTGSSAQFYSHSGDILNGKNGAAEYIDIKVADAKKAGVRYVLMNANVYSGDTFDQFECNVGVMIRDGQTGKHFECSTVETKLSLDSNTRNTTPAVLDLETGEMIYIDLHGRWGEYENVETKSASLKQALRYFINYDDYRPSFNDVLRFAGTVGAPAAKAVDITDNQDEILEMLSTK